MAAVEASGLAFRSAQPSDAVKSRVRQAELELGKARMLRATAGARPKAPIRNGIKLLEAKARRLLREAEYLARSEAESAWFEQAIRETVELAELRGEVVLAQAVPGGGQRVVMLSRGSGLEHARDNGYLAGVHGRDETDDLYLTGDKYRSAYEVVEGRLSRRGEGGGGFGPKGPQVRLAEAGQMLETMRGALNLRQRKVLDAVCGDGLGMFEAAKACGMGTPATRNALRGGLVAAQAALRTASKAGTQDVGGALTAAHAAVARAGRGL